MARSTVFISYSKKDQKYLEHLIEQLAPFDLDLEPWTDREIGAGESWRRQIEHAMKKADAAVVLVSPSLLATSFVCRVEMPFLMEAANEKKLLFAPLFVRPSNVEHKVFKEVLNPATQELGARITDFQGLNRPDKAVSTLPSAEQDGIWATCARKLWERVQVRRAEHRQTPKRLSANRIATVHLKLDGARIDRSYSVPGGDVISGRSCQIDIDQLRSLRTTRNDLELGERLFRILFGDEAEYLRHLPATFDKPTPTAHFGIRVQVLTESPDLRDLPWACCAWRQRFLADQQWTFELIDRPGRQAEIQIEAPCAAVMIGPEFIGDDSLSSHFKTFEDVLDRSWDHPRLDLQWIQTAEQLEQTRAVVPQLIYLFAPAQTSRRGLEIALSGPGQTLEYVALESILEGWLDGRPSIVVLTTFGGCHLVQALPGADVVLHLRNGKPSRKAREWAMTFWSEVLDGRTSPALAFHQLGAAARRIGAIWTRYSNFETRVSDRTPKVHRARMKLDRRLQREAVMTLLRDLTRGPRRKVTAVVAFGSNGNLVEHFAEQMVSTIREWAGETARLHKHKLVFPDPGRPLELEDFDEELRERLHIQPEQPLFEGIEAKTRRGAKSVPVHLLVWDSSTRAVEPRGPDLAAWLRYSSEYLSAAVRGTARVISYVAIKLEHHRHPGLVHFFDGQSQLEHLQLEHFRLEILQPLEPISPKDLRDFLRDDANSSCPPDIRDEVAARICQWTGGEFEKTIKLIERAEKGNLWRDLVAMLPEATSDPLPEDF